MEPAAVGLGRGRGRGSVTGGDDRELRRPHNSSDSTLAKMQPSAGEIASTPESTAPATMQNNVSLGNHEEDLQKKLQSLQLDAESDKSQNQTSNPGANGITMAAPKVGGWNVDAMEFVPRAAAELKPQAQPFVPQTNAPVLPQISNQMQQGMMSNGIPQPQPQYMCHPVVLQVNSLVVQLSLKPNKFNHIAMQLTTICTWQVPDMFLMKEVIAVIFEQGVGEENFRYSGARLCQYLSQHVKQCYNGPTFRSLLLCRCQEEFNIRDVYMASEPARVCGFIMFLADLFTQLLTPSQQPMEVLGTALCKLIITLLSQPHNENVKCAARVLKLCGARLDEMFRADMESVVNRLKDVAMTAPVDSSSRAMLLNVVELRASGWGQAGSESDSSSGSNAHPLGTVYYGPGGVVTYVDEEPEDSASDTEDLAHLGWSAVEELEGEAADAFEEFLKMQQQQ